MKSFKIKNIISRVIFLSLPLMVGVGGGLCSCSSDDEYTPAEPVAADNWGVYFDGDNESEYVREPDDEPVITLKLRRDNTQGALTVPIVLSQVVGEITAPESVTFADGEGEATLQVTYGGFPEVLPSAVLSVPAIYTNPYKEKNGFWQQKIQLAKTELIVDNFSLVNGDDYESPTAFTGAMSQIKWFVGQNKFVFTNFFGSGIDLMFKLDIDNNGNFDPNDITKCWGGIVPLTNHYDSDYGWTLIDSDGNMPTWTPAGSSLEVSSLFLYNYYGGSSYNTIYFDYNMDGTAGYGLAIFYATYVNDDMMNHAAYFELVDKYQKK